MAITLSEKTIVKSAGRPLIVRGIDALYYAQEHFYLIRRATWARHLFVYYSGQAFCTFEEEKYKIDGHDLAADDWEVHDA